MGWYKKILNVKYETDLCYHSIITQNYLHNSIHIDKKSIIRKDSSAKIMKVHNQCLKQNKLCKDSMYILSCIFWFSEFWKYLSTRVELSKSGNFKSEFIFIFEISRFLWVGKEIRVLF